MLALLKVKCEIHYASLNPIAWIPWATSNMQKKLSPKIALHFKVLCESKATLPLAGFGAQLSLLSKILQDLFYLPMSMFKFSNVSPQTYENGLLLPL